MSRLGITFHQYSLFHVDLILEWIITFLSVHASLSAVTNSHHFSRNLKAYICVFVYSL